MGVDTSETSASTIRRTSSIHFGDSSGVVDLDEDNLIVSQRYDGVPFDDFVLEELELSDCEAAFNEAPEHRESELDLILREALEEIGGTDEKYASTGGGSYFCWCVVVYPLKKKNTRSILRLHRRLVAAGLTVCNNVKPRKGKNMFWRMGMSPAMLEVGAEEMGLMMDLKPDAPMASEYHRLQARFSREKREQFVTNEDGEIAFTSAEMQQVVKFVMMDRAHFDFRALHRQKLVKQVFPTHNVTELRQVERHVQRAIFRQPVQMIRMYFGEKFGIYFAYLNFWTQWLAAPAVAGVGLFIFQCMTGRIDTIPQLLFTLGIFFWGVFYLRFWKRREAKLGAEWDRDDQIEEEFPREEYLKRSVLKMSKVSRSVEPHYPSLYTRLWTVFFSLPVVSCLVVTTVCVVITITLLRVTTHKLSLGGWMFADALTGVMHALIITLMNYIFAGITARLTVRETHRTDRVYEDMLIVKMFVLEFVNTFTGVFHTAFVKGRYSTDMRLLETCHGEKGDFLFFPRQNERSCLVDMEVQVFTLFITLSAIGNFKDIIVPLVDVAFAHFFLCVRRKKERDPMLEEAQRPRVDKLVPALFWDYNDLVMEFAFVTLCSTAWSLIPLVALLNNIIKSRADAFSMFRSYQRPHYMRKHVIGTWYNVMVLLMGISMLSNVGVIGFTAKKGFALMIPGMTMYDKLWVLVLVEHCLVMFTLFAVYIIDDKDAATQVTLKKRRYRIQVENDKHMHERVKLLSDRSVERRLESHFEDKERGFKGKIKRKLSRVAPTMSDSGETPTEEEEIDFASARGSVASMASEDKPSSNEPKLE